MNFLIKFLLKSWINRKQLQPETQYIILALAQGGNLISAPWLSAPVPQQWLYLNFLQECSLHKPTFPLVINQELLPLPFSEGSFSQVAAVPRLKFSLLTLVISHNLLLLAALFFDSESKKASLKIILGRNANFHTQKYSIIVFFENDNQPHKLPLLQVSYLDLTTANQSWVSYPNLTLSRQWNTIEFINGNSIIIHNQYTFFILALFHISYFIYKLVFTFNSYCTELL